MKTGMVTDSLANLDTEAMMATAAAAGVQGLEVTTGNWSTAPHLDLQAMLQDAPHRRRFLDGLDRHGLELIALNANGNQLHPVSGARHDAVIKDTIRLAGELGVKTVVLMSGLPGGAPTDTTPNWIVSSWPPETASILAWQWEERLLPYWHGLAHHARQHGVERLCVEMHGNQLIYNVPTLLRLRAEIGSVVGANLDPSHLFWMGADPLRAIDALGSAIHHVHAKDTFINEARRATTSLLENGSLMDIEARAWSYITVGFGHAEDWWRRFCYRLRMAGYDGWLAIEHEDVLLSRAEGVRRSVAVLRSAAPDEPGDFDPQAV